jgi:hypothetical protein
MGASRLIARKRRNVVQLAGSIWRSAWNAN